jgi:hypothetical protein
MPATVSAKPTRIMKPAMMALMKWTGLGREMGKVKGSR